MIKGRVGIGTPSRDGALVTRDVLEPFLSPTSRQPLNTMRVGDYTASIVVDEKELEEYKVTLDLSTTAATCWVASEVGKVRHSYLHQRVSGTDF